MKKKTKARGRSRFRGDPKKEVRIQRNKESSRRRRKTEKKTAKHKKNLRNNLKKKIEEERKKLEERKKFLVKTSKLHRDSRLEITPNNLKIIVSFMQGLKVPSSKVPSSKVPSLPFDIIETILIETDKYNKIKEIFESFKFKKKLKNLKQLVENIKYIDEAFVIENLDVKKLEDDIKEFQNNLTNFHRLLEIEELKNHFETQKDLLTKIMEQIGNFYDSVEDMLDNAYHTIPGEIFDVIEKFYHDFYEEDYEDNY